MADEIRDLLCWRGPVSVNVFVIGAGNTPLPEEAFHLAGMVPDAFLPFPLLEQPEAIERLGPVSYDMDFDDTSLDLREYMGAVLRYVCADTRAVAWAAFEGAFHYDELLTDQVAHQVYGYCTTGTEPVAEALHHAIEPDNTSRHQRRRIQAVLSGRAQRTRKSAKAPGSRGIELLKRVSQAGIRPRRVKGAVERFSTSRPGPEGEQWQSPILTAPRSGRGSLPATRLRR
ncbi:hypothetical protein [Streptomyces sp. NPDC005498]|uniref:hypothetical protein n=1 Tax=Streptomyces sp. NPDC005498 TaxID=3364717 RepID=UPI00367B9150